MRVPGIIVARTDAEAATFLDNRTDERDQPFILGATNLDLPSYRVGFLAILKALHDLGLDEVRGHLLFAVPEDELRQAVAWLGRVGLHVAHRAEREARSRCAAAGARSKALLDAIDTRYAEVWQAEAGLKTYGEAVAEVLEIRIGEGERFDDDARGVAGLRARTRPSREVRARAESLDIRVAWDPELPKTPDGYYQVQGGIDYAIAKSLAAAPFADLLWMETKTADLEDARRFAEAIHAAYPDKMLAYNLSPSFNWDTTGLSDDEMRRFPRSSGSSASSSTSSRTAGHQIDGLAAEEFATALREDGMLALARLQRKFRLLESPVPNAAVTRRRRPAGRGVDGRFRADRGDQGDGQGIHAAPAPGPDRGADQAAGGVAGGMGEPLGSAGDDPRRAAAAHRRDPTSWSFASSTTRKSPLADVIFASMLDRHGLSILSIRDQNTSPTVRRRRLMTLVQLFLIHRYHAGSVHYVTPTEDNLSQTQRMKDLGIFTVVRTEIGQIIVADVDRLRVAELLLPNGEQLAELIRKPIPQPA